MSTKAKSVRVKSSSDSCNKTCRLQT